jgi:hypothetical protein
MLECEGIREREEEMNTPELNEVIKKLQKQEESYANQYDRLINEANMWDAKRQAVNEAVRTVERYIDELKSHAFE